MADTVETAVYKMQIEGADEVRDAANAVDKLATEEEKLTRTTRFTGDAMDRLLGKLDPRIRAEQSLARTLDYVNRLEQEGIGTAAQRAQAISAATIRYNDAIQRLNSGAAVNPLQATGQAAQLSAMQMANLSFQIQDVSQALLTGQPLFTTFIQQGSQIVQIFGPGVGVGAALKSIGTGIMSFLLNPLNLAVLGFAAVAGSAQYFYRAVTDGSKDTENLLERHKDLVEEVRDSYEAAGNSADNWRQKLSSVTSVEVTDNLRQQKTLLQEIMEGLSIGQWGGGLTGNAVDPFTVLLGQAGRGFRGEVDALRALNDAASSGAIDVEEYRRQLDAIGSTTRSQAIREFTAEMLRSSQAALDQANVVREAEDAEKARNGTLQETITLLDLMATSSKKSAGATGEMSKVTQEAVKNAKAAAQAAIDLNITAGEKDRTQFGAINALNTELRQTEAELRKVEQAMRNIKSDGTLDKLFPEATKIEGANRALRDAVTTMDLLFANLEQGSIAPQRVQEEIDRIRDSLVAMGLNSSAVDRLIDTFVRAAQQAMGLRDSVELLSNSIRNIPDRTVTITTVYRNITTGGGNVGVSYPSGTDMSKVGATTTTYPSGVTVMRPNSSGGSVPQGGSYIPGTIGGLTNAPQGKAAGGPVSAGATYLVGEEGPELVTMGGAGNVSTASATASILSGGSNVLRAIEENTFLTVEEMRRAVSYLETVSTDVRATVGALDNIRSALRSGMSSGGGGGAGGGRTGGTFSSAMGGGPGGSGGSAGFMSHLDPLAPYYFNPNINPGGVGWGAYSPVADAMLNGNKAALKMIGSAPQNNLLETPAWLSGGVPPGYGSQAAWLRAQLMHGAGMTGFDTGGYIAPGDTQRVQFFKRPDEAVAVLRPEQREAVGEAMTASKTVNMGGITINVSAPTGQLSPRSMLEMRDGIRRAVQSAAGDL